MVGVTPHTFEIHGIETEREAADLIAHIRRTGECAVDTETTGLHWALGDKAFMATFAPDADHAYWSYDPELVFDILRAMEDMGSLFVFHNAVFDFHMLRSWNAWRPAMGYRYIKLLDTMHAFRIQHPGESAALKIASQQFCGDMDVEGPQTLVRDWIRDNTVIRKVAGKSVREEPTFDKVPHDLMAPYAAQDVILTIRSHQALARERDAWEQPERCIGKVPPLPVAVLREMEVIKTVTEMERVGMPVSLREIKRGLAEAVIEQARCAGLWEKSAYSGFSPTSPVQMKKLMYEVLGEPIKHRTKPTTASPQGSPSTSEAALVDAETEEGKIVAGLLLPMRSWKKYGERLTEIDSYTGRDSRVHTSLKADAAKTGRFSSTQPALQNLTRPNIEKPYTMARACFQPPKGKELLLADFSQIELRLAAHYMRDQIMTHALNTGQDFHQLTASLMYGIPFDQVTKKQRAIAKILNFSILYGAGVKRVTETLRYGAAGTDALTPEECKHAILQLKPDDFKIIDTTLYKRLSDDWEGLLDSESFTVLAKALLDAYHAGSPKVREFTNSASASAEKHKGVFTAFGLFIPIVDYYYPALGKWLSSNHKAANAIIQGTAAGLMKETLCRTADACERFCADNNLTMWDDVALLMSIHDETIIEVPEGMGVELAKYMDAELSVWPQFNIDIKLEYALVKAGSSWATKEGFEWRTAA